LAYKVAALLGKILVIVGQMPSLGYTSAKPLQNKALSLP